MKTVELVMAFISVISSWDIRNNEGLERHDMQIGGHARSEGLIVVTNNMRAFIRMPGPRIGCDVLKLAQESKSIRESFQELEH